MNYYPFNYKIFGKGKSFVLFLHGWGGSTNSFLSQASRMSKYNKVCLIDFYGFGNSKYPNKVLDCYDYALQLYLFLVKKNINKISIVAHSFGGRIAIILSSLFNIDIEKMVLVDSAGVKPKRGFKYKFKVFKYKLLKKLVKLHIAKPNSLSKYGSEEYKQLGTLQKQGYVKIVNQDLTYLLKRIGSKVLIVWGNDDKVTPLYMAKTIKKYISGSVLYVYLNSGHFSYLENHANFCNLITTFIGS